MSPFGGVGGGDASISSTAIKAASPGSSANSPLNMRYAHGAPSNSPEDKLGRRPSNSMDMDNDMSDHDENPAEAGDERGDPSSAVDDKSRRRRRSRKGLDKRYQCLTEGCGKTYSRAEHLYRHQLNHNSKQIFRCEYPDCPRTFVRGDLLKRHMDRHAVKGSQLNRTTTATAGRSAAVVSPTQASPEMGRAPLLKNEPQEDITQAQTHEPAQTQTQTQAQAHIYQHSHSQAYAHADVNANANAHAHAHAHANAHAHASPHLYPLAHDHNDHSPAHAHAHIHIHTSPHAYAQPRLHDASHDQAYTSPHIYPQAYSHDPTHAQTSPHTYPHSPTQDIDHSLNHTLNHPHSTSHDHAHTHTHSHTQTQTQTPRHAHAQSSCASPHPFASFAGDQMARFPAATMDANRNGHNSESTRGALSSPQRSGNGQPSGASAAGSVRHSIQTNVAPFGVMSSALNHQGYDHHDSHAPQSAGLGSQQQVMPFSLPPSQYSQFTASTAPGQGPSAYAAVSTSAESLHASELAMLDHMAIQSAGTVFGEEGLNKSPYVGMSEDFMVYLFNSLPANGSPAPQTLPPPLLNYGHVHNQYPAAPVDENGAATLLAQQPQQVMAVNNLLDQDAPEASISEQRSQEIFDFIRERFKAGEDESEQQLRANILGGDRSSGDHMLSRRMMQAYIGSYWHHFSDQMPILHKPTFSSEKTPIALLIAIMAIGAACLDRTQGARVTKAGAKVSNFLAEHLRWEVFMDASFRPPARLWIFQTLILLELYEKMYSTRELHERAHIHHATTITLMRRGRSFIGKSVLDSPPHFRDGEVSRKPSSSYIAHTPDEWWNHWITNEATRRAAFAAFVMDSTHATMFGHSAVMVAHEMRLPLPCDESLWKAPSSAEVGRVEANLMSRGIKPIAFLEGLKRTLSHQEVRTTSFGRTVLMAGLLSVTYHMHQRDLQVNILGGGVIQALGGRDKWRATLTRAYDSWKSDFDAALEQSEPLANPYGHDEANHEFNTIVESRTALHHLAHMAMHADIVDCQIYAHAKRLLGRTIGSQEFHSAQRRIKDFWAPSARARDAAFYALKFLCSVLVSDHHQAGAHQQGGKPYRTRDDDLLNRPWVLYFAALVVWCYGYAIQGPCPDVQGPVTHHDKWTQARAYLTKYGSVTDPNELRDMRGINGTTALLMVLQDSFEGSRWELLHEAAALLHNCIVLNHGSIPIP